MKQQSLSRPSPKVAPPRRWNLWKDSKISGVGLILLLMLLWEISARAKWIDMVAWPPISVILAKWIDLIASGEIPRTLLASLTRMAVGYAVATTIAVPIGILMGYYRVFFNLLEPLTESFRPIPSSALLPILILFLGFDDEMKIVLITYASFFPILLNTYSGVRYVDPVLINTGRTFGLTTRQILMKIVLPAASPYIFTGMRISLAVSLILTVIAEMVAGNSGIGYFTFTAQRGFRVADMYAGIITLGVVGYSINVLFVALERRLMRWQVGASRQVV